MNKRASNIERLVRIMEQDSGWTRLMPSEVGESYSNFLERMKLMSKRRAEAAHESLLRDVATQFVDSAAHNGITDEEVAADITEMELVLKRRRR